MTLIATTHARSVPPSMGLHSVVMACAAASNSVATPTSTAVDVAQGRQLVQQLEKQAMDAHEQAQAFNKQGRFEEVGLSACTHARATSSKKRSAVVLLCCTTQHANSTHSTATRKLCTRLC